MKSFSLFSLRNWRNGLCKTEELGKQFVFYHCVYGAIFFEKKYNQFQNKENSFF